MGFLVEEDARDVGNAAQQELLDTRKRHGNYEEHDRERSERQIGSTDAFGVRILGVSDGFGIVRPPPLSLLNSELDHIRGGERPADGDRRRAERVSQLVCLAGEHHHDGEKLNHGARGEQAGRGRAVCV